MLLLSGFTFSCLWAFGLGQLEPIEISVTRAVSQSAQISCKVSLEGFDKVDIHWYRQKTNQPFEYLIYVRNDNTHRPLEGISKKIEAKKDLRTSTATLIINSLKKEDEAIYYCALWVESSWIKVFSKGTKLIVIPSDKHLGSDVSPKPTIFLPSVAETNLHKAGTYLCLLEKFFPDVIRVYWKEKDGDKILKSQEGNSMKTNNTYMKFSWLTVTEDSMDKEHKCIVKHENNQGGVDQEILFPPIDKVANIISPTEAYLKTENAFTTITINPRGENVNNTTDLEACLEERRDVLQIQVTNTSAFYTYLILFFKSVVHLAFVMFCVFRRAALRCDGQSS
ncbi:T-cell receptor gamma chain C region 5/10-13 [Peromyscus maniculatus bairdii]|uniref:T-cell receptor gamma chain C region 5/10-13 n=1 Tax=Peromyscus maniculatus bairdii TaxID=230844 RepID=UPI00077D9D94|nr:T-cell receptor gamma chain C region 5/10-13 [Peromyscus maniculatus bairdii]